MSKKPVKHQRSVTPLDKAIGLKIRVARHDAKLSQDDLGSALGVSFQQVQKYEKGVNRVPPVRLVAIAKATGKPTTFFLQEPDYKPNTNGEKLAQFAASRLGHQILSATMALQPHLQQAVVDFTRTLAREAA
jgi:transcriptional regulator with XRE-family HTH domain